MARLKELFFKEIALKMQKKFEYKSSMEVPRLEKIVINSGIGDLGKDAKLSESVIRDISMLSGQKPLLTKARKDISNFGIRAGDIIGCKVTLRDTMMYEFLDRLISLAIPRMKDFRGISPKSFDGTGNYTLGIEEHIIFPEVSYDKLFRIIGLNITIVSSAKSDDKALELLRSFGMPFREN